MGSERGRIGRRRVGALIVAMAVAGCSVSRESDENRIERELRSVATRGKWLRADPSEPVVACRRTEGRFAGLALYLCTVEFKNSVFPDFCAIVSKGSVLVGGQEQGGHRCGAGRFRPPRPDMFA